MISFEKELSIEDGIRIYVKNKHYSDSFGWQWKKFSKTQIDDQDHDNSYLRLLNECGGDLSIFNNKTVLELGSGAGRFTNILLKYTSATVYSVDSSEAVKVNRENNSSFINKRLFIFKASLYDLPFDKNQFDIVLCLGVLQHTPDHIKSMNCLVENINKNGMLILDFYPLNGFWTYIHAKYIFRPITKRLDKNKLLKILDKYLDLMIKMSEIFIKLKIHHLNRFIPIADIKNAIPDNLEKNRRRDVILLDTFDMLSPENDRPLKIKKVSKYLSKFLDIKFAGKIKYKNFSSAVVRGIKN